MMNYTKKKLDELRKQSSDMEHIKEKESIDVRDEKILILRLFLEEEKQGRIPRGSREANEAGRRCMTCKNE